MSKRPLDEESIATRKLKWKESESGKVIVFRPCLGQSRIGKKISVLFGFADYRIRLDKTGSEVWKSCDGETSIREMRGRLGKSLPDEEQCGLEERLTAFLHQMNRSGMITILTPDKNKS